ncbi:transcription factor JUNGBRUNNEN 1-like isoform X2 [Punica granatum]|uniref:NAC domain-containing protein n=2 Tax=Punica granatum TaxID=22663 RepID=A0A218X1S1_PUNGR|nr:transcription factor JUNGBRUNNEN 1-like isoform X2 [Punica granatum]OWM78778.1 hypothetical protein CDL15_Pgr002949 [Punica granatum]PKI31342.1 hypothetical protein CRG98_048268 [Punica granatum]
MERGRSSLDVSNKKDEELEVVLPGFRFYPTDEELLGFYLRRKVEGKLLRVDQLIKHIDIYKYNPWDLPMNGGDKEWYFFCMRGRKYKNSVRPNRVTGSGFWKATGIDKPVYSTKESHECVGLKKSLVYYRGTAGKGTKTDWMMHEFRLPPTGKSGHLPSKRIIAEEEAEVWTLCRIFKRTPVPSRKYIPEGKDKKPDAIKDTMIISTTMDSSSKSCSFDSDYGEHYLSFGDSVINQQKERKPMTAGGQLYCWSGNYSNSEPYKSFWDVNEDQDFFADQELDELRSVAHRAISSSQVYGYDFS